MFPRIQLLLRYEPSPNILIIHCGGNDIFLFLAYVQKGKKYFSPFFRIIIVSGEIAEETAISAMHSGAQDFVMKDNLARLVPVIMREFKQHESAAALAAANKRVGNILAKNPAELADSVNTELLEAEQERTLYQLVSAKQTELAPVFANRQYQQALAELATLRPAVDAFFDNVMVMADDEAVKLNRLLLLSQLRNLFLQIADISVLQ